MAKVGLLAVTLPVGASLTVATATITLLEPMPPRPSLTLTLTVRVAVLGSVLVLLYISAATSVFTRDAVALLLKVTIRSWPLTPSPLLAITPMLTPPTVTTLPTLVPLDKDTMPLVSTPSTSCPLWPLAEMCTVRLPPLKLEVSLSVTVTAVPVSSFTAPPFSVKVGLSLLRLPITGAESAATVTVLVTALLLIAPSLMTKRMVRELVVGDSELSE